MFDIVVVGGGLIGSSSARHLAEAGHRVTLIAAPEPKDWSLGKGPFASHYDAGRITRAIADDEVWAELAVRSIERYADIELRSGVSFHDPRGLAWLGHEIEDAVRYSNRRGGDAHMVSVDWLFDTTGIRAPEALDLQVAFEGPPAGSINPRALAQAQKKLAELAGATIIDAECTAVGPGQSGVVVRGEFGEVRTDRALLATGAYAAELVDVELDLKRLLRTTLRVDLGPAPELPALIAEPVPHPQLYRVYWVPPVRYPDGRTLFKIGCEMLDPPLAESNAEVDAWFGTNGDSAEAAALLETTRQFLPNHDLKSWDTMPCVITETASGYPFVGFVDDRVAVAVGGNGASAKSSDEIGRLAANLFDEGGWRDETLSQDLFTPAIR